MLVQRWVPESGHVSRSDADAVGTHLRHSKLLGHLGWFEMVKPVVQLLGRVAAAQSRWSCIMCAAVLASVLLTRYAWLCAVPAPLPGSWLSLWNQRPHSSHRLTDSYWSAAFWSFSFVYRWKASKSLYPEKSGAAFPPVWKVCAAFLQFSDWASPVPVHTLCTNRHTGWEWLGPLALLRGSWCAAGCCDRQHRFTLSHKAARHLPPQLVGAEARIFPQLIICICTDIWMKTIPLLNLNKQFLSSCKQVVS